MSVTYRGWLHRLQLKDLLGDETDPESTRVAAAGMHERLEKFRLKYFPVDEEIEQISDEFHTIAFVDGPSGKADADYFNSVLDALYDWSDTDRRLWVE